MLQLYTLLYWPTAVFPGFSVCVVTDVRLENKYGYSSIINKYILQGHNLLIRTEFVEQVGLSLVSVSP